MKKSLYGALFALLLAPASLAQTNGQLIDCDSPNPEQPEKCTDNWALDALDSSKTAIENRTGALPRNRKHYFSGMGAGVHIFMLDTGIEPINPDFDYLDQPGAPNRLEEHNGLKEDSTRENGSHGTRTASLASGLQYGVAKGAILHSVNAANLGGLFQTGGDILLERLNWIYDRVTLDGMTPAVLNMSFNILLPITDGDGIDMGAQLDQRVLDLIDAGVVVVASAGNRDSITPEKYWPANIWQVILVGGLDQQGGRWLRHPEHDLCKNKGDCGSNYGPLVDIWAPAEHIRAAVHIRDRDLRIGSGTSYAAPLVAGLAALRLEQNNSLTPAQVRAALLADAAYLGDIDGDGTGDYMARTQAIPTCEVPQRMFVNSSQSRLFYGSQLFASCPTGVEAYAHFNAEHGTVRTLGLSSTDSLYDYTPNTSYVGLDDFTYTVYTDTGAVLHNGTVLVTVQPDHN